jgi:RNA polymerase sigma-70 factor, ECF subfamily
MEQLFVQDEVLELSALTRTETHGNPFAGSTEDFIGARPTVDVKPPANIESDARAVQPLPERPEANRRHGYRVDSPPEELALLHQAKAGETEAFAELYRLHVATVTRYVGARMRDRDAVPDLVQDAFCEALAALPSAHNDVRGWFLAHASVACLHHTWSNRRYVRAAKELHEESLTRSGEHPDVSVRTVATIGHLGLAHALSRLTTDERRAIQLRFLDGLPPAYRAIALNRPPDGVRGLERRALKKLRENIVATQVTGSRMLRADRA